MKPGHVVLPERNVKSRRFMANAEWAVRINYICVTPSVGSGCNLRPLMDPRIRAATDGDLRSINAIYNMYIVGRHTSFDLEPWTIAERTSWFEKYRTHGRYRVLVMELDGVVVGFASSSPFRAKKAYDTSVETTIVLDERVLGRGLGKILLPALLDELADCSIHRAYALIALPNEPSVSLHAANGYREVGVLEDVGYKLGSYHSVLIMERGF
jgi:phosphinothricin acetyltransferase